jgi:hypothetical protein
MSVRPSEWNNSAPTERIYIKSDIWVFFEKQLRKFQVLLKSDKNEENFKLGTIYIFDHIPLSCS